MSADIAVRSQLTRTEADRLTKRLRNVAESTYTSLRKLRDLLDEAQQGEAHIVLGYPSWTAYVVGVLGDREPIRLDVDERRALVGELTEAGMSTRAVAAVVGTNQATVVRDLGRSGDASAPPDKLSPVVGLDGKKYTRKRPAAPAKPARRSPAPDDADDRGTPIEIVTELGSLLGRPFTLDVAAAPHNAKAPRYFTRDPDGRALTHPRFGCVAAMWRGGDPDEIGGEREETSDDVDPAR